MLHASTVAVPRLPTGTPRLRGKKRTATNTIAHTADKPRKIAMNTKNISKRAMAASHRSRNRSMQLASLGEISWNSKRLTAPRIGLPHPVKNENNCTTPSDTVCWSSAIFLLTAAVACLPRRRAWIKVAAASRLRSSLRLRTRAWIVLAAAWLLAINYRKFSGIKWNLQLFHIYSIQPYLGTRREDLLRPYEENGGQQGAGFTILFQSVRSHTFDVRDGSVAPLSTPQHITISYIRVITHKIHRVRIYEYVDLHNLDLGFRSRPKVQCPGFSNA